MSEKTNEVRLQRHHVTFLERRSQSEAFNEAYLKTAARLQANLREQFVASRNVQRFYHGEKQVFFRENEPENTEMHSHSVEMTTRFQDIIDGDLTIVPGSLQTITEGLHREFTRSIYTTVSTTCDKTGNTVDARLSGSPAAAFEEMLDKVEFIADIDENVNMPEIHAAPDQAKRLYEALMKQPEEYRQRIEAIKARKSGEAIERERKRKARFTKYGE